MPDIRRATSRGGESMVHLLIFAVAESTEANNDSLDSMNCSFRDSYFSPGEPGNRPWVMKLRLNKTRRTISSMRRHGMRMMIGPKNMDQHSICIGWGCAFRKANEAENDPCKVHVNEGAI